MPELSNREDSYALRRLINSENAAEGSSLPPPQIGPFRVPYVKSVRVSSPEATKYRVTWIEPEGFTARIAQFNIFIILSGGIRQPIGPFSTTKSPLTIQILLSPGTVATFFVQTQLSSGFTNPVALSPSAAITAS